MATNSVVGKKRKGKYFITENYLDEEAKKCANDVIMAAYQALVEKQGEDKTRRLFIGDEVSMWAAPMGVMLFQGHSVPYTDSTVCWKDIQIDDETYIGLMQGLRKAFEKYGTDANKMFKVIFNDEQYQTLKMLIEV